jgi:hypothetical protein
MKNPTLGNLMTVSLKNIELLLEHGEYIFRCTTGCVVLQMCDVLPSQHRVRVRSPGKISYLSLQVRESFLVSIGLGKRIFPNLSWIR